jgi:hypothetical protein
MAFRDGSPCAVETDKVIRCAAPDNDLVYEEKETLVAATPSEGWPTSRPYRNQS